jgi:hypothetical protein
MLFIRFPSETLFPELARGSMTPFLELAERRLGRDMARPRPPTILLNATL